MTSLSSTRSFVIVIWKMLCTPKIQTRKLLHMAHQTIIVILDQAYIWTNPKESLMVGKVEIYAPKEV